MGVSSSHLASCPDSRVVGAGRQLRHPVEHNTQIIIITRVLGVLTRPLFFGKPHETRVSFESERERERERDRVSVCVSVCVCLNE